MITSFLFIRKNILLYLSPYVWTYDILQILKFIKYKSNKEV